MEIDTSMTEPQRSPPAGPAAGNQGGGTVSGRRIGEGGPVETFEVGPERQVGYEHIHMEGQGGHKSTGPRPWQGLGQ